MILKQKDKKRREIWKMPLLKTNFMPLVEKQFDSSKLKRQNGTTQKNKSNKKIVIKLKSTKLNWYICKMFLKTEAD